MNFSLKRICIYSTLCYICTLVYEDCFILIRYSIGFFSVWSATLYVRTIVHVVNALRTAIEGKRVIMVDDSIVRGTTCGRLVKLLRDAGAAEVHMRISAPPFRHPCFFGTDIPERNQLLAHNRTVEEMREIIGVDSLGFLSLEACRKIAVGCKLGFCDACFSGEYPIPVPEQVDKNMFEIEIPLPANKD